MYMSLTKERFAAASAAAAAAGVLPFSVFEEVCVRIVQLVVSRMARPLDHTRTHAHTQKHRS